MMSIMKYGGGIEMTKRTKCKLCGEWVAGIEQGPMPPDLDIEVEVSGMPKPKHTRMTTLKVESRGRAWNALP